MTAKQRERILMMILPATLIVLVWFGWLRPTEQLKKLASDLDSARAKAVPDVMLEAAQQRERSLQTDLAKLTAEVKQLVGQWNQLRTSIDVPSDRPATVAQASELFRRHGLTLLREQPISNGGRDDLSQRPLGKVLDRIRKPMDTLVPELKPDKTKRPAPSPAAVVNTVGTSTAEMHFSDNGSATIQPVQQSFNQHQVLPAPMHRTLWQIEFAGRYNDVVTALAHLAESDSGAIPVTLSMAAAKPNLSMRLWTLVVWF